MLTKVQRVQSSQYSAVANERPTSFFLSWREFQNCNFHRSATIQRNLHFQHCKIDAKALVVAK